MPEIPVPPSERSPLLLSRRSTSNYDETTLSSDGETVRILMKTCMGTGCLALPFACQQGGLVLFGVGLGGIALWNVYSVQRLIACLDYLPVYTADNRTEEQESQETYESQQSHPPPEISMLGKVAWYAYGRAGVEILDAMMMVLLLGVIVAYFCAILTFLKDTPLSLGDLGDGVVAAVILTVISLVPHIGVLSHASALGLAVLFGTFAVIFGYGLVEESETTESLAWWPTSRQGLAQWFGVIVFGFGIVPMTYNYHASMKQPARMVLVTAYAMGATALSYLIAGLGLYALFPTLKGDVLSELPKTGILPILTRLSMVVVVLMTAPLIVVPLSELLQGKWQRQEIWMIRLGICALSCVVAVAYPEFVRALSLVGSTCVAAVSFLIPPLLHARLLWMQRQKITGVMVVDGVMLALGCALTIISTIYNLQ